MKTKLDSVKRGMGGLHVKTRGKSGYSIGTKKSSAPAKRGSRIVLGNMNKGTSNLSGTTK